MPLDMVKARRWLADFDLKSLFREGLGWDRFHVQPFDVEAEGRSFRVEPVAEKCGFAVFACRPCDGGAMPDYPTRRKVEQRVRKLYHEHFLVFTDGKQSEQKWLWVRREPGKPAVGREYDYAQGKSGDSLLQRISELAVALDEELQGLVITDMVGKVHKGFDRDRVTKRFYDRFKDEHAKFLKFLKGIPDEQMQRWYVSVMLNRLMFIYFIQKKGFLGDSDTDYLRNKLKSYSSLITHSSSFYKDFLCPLFFEGFAKKEDERSDKTRRLLGRVPYLNGGIFQKHQIEQQHGREIDIPDAAFDRLFAFFDEYRWHLDERPLKDDREINPDVLGYIFEKYINQKQMGAYYTKEDITEYIGRETIVPRLLDMARQKCKVAFEGDSSVWRLLRDNPDRYIFEPVRRGVINPDGSILPESKLPDFVQVGMHDPKKRMFEKRYNLGDAELHDDKGNSLTLPTETWREYAARRKRCLELRDKLARGEVRDVNDLITYNLDIRRFAQDVVEDSDPDLLRAVWRGLINISVLDPTCGSGAFLFAALNILQPLYEACLERMRGLFDELGRSGEKHSPKKYEDFRKALDQVGEHPNERYFILKSIIIGNLFGVDIMDEAVEICRLRLFLKLAAQVEPDPAKDNFGIEPLPDIDFNVRAGNTLVGYATYDQVKRAVSSKLDFEGAMEKIEEKAQELDRAMQMFRRQQTELGGEVTAEDKAALQSKLRALEHELNLHLAREYGIKIPPSASHSALITHDSSFSSWLASHRPFHWFVEFYGIMKSGGFDVIIGNPPYVEYRLVVDEYSLPHAHYKSEASGNLYAFCMERSCELASAAGRFGMIAPTAAVGLDETSSLRQVLLGRFALNHCSTYSIRPSKLFEGVDQRLCIWLGHSHARHPGIMSTTYRHWNEEERQYLFAHEVYAPVGVHPRLDRIPQIGAPEAATLLDKLEQRRKATVLGYYSRVKAGYLLHYHRSPRYWIRAMDFEQHFRSPTRKRSVYHFRNLYFRDRASGEFVGALLNSSLFFFWFLTLGNGRNLTGADIEFFPVGDLKDDVTSEAKRAFGKLMKDYKNNSFIRRRTDCEYQEFQPGMSKPIIDQIDQVLAKHYGFTDEELDFIINYDIKYRMGKAINDE
jgi:hypothetical protein